MGDGVELVLIGADAGPDRAFAASGTAGEGARRLAEVLPARFFDSGTGGCRLTLVPPDADANAMLTALRQATRRPARRLVVGLLGRLATDPRGRRLALVTAGSIPDNAYRRGLAWDWVVGSMVHGAPQDALLLVDAIADRAAWAALDGAAAELLARSRVPLWGRIAQLVPGRRGRDATTPGGPGSFSRALADVLERGVPGAPAAVGPTDLHPAVAAAMTRPARRPDAAARLLVPDESGRLLMHNRAAVRGALAGSSLSDELLAVLWPENTSTDQVDG